MDYQSINSIFALSLLLAAGFAGARLAKLVRLPSVTGYILAGILLGPSAFDIIPHHLMEQELRVFTEIALMLVAFGIGERFDLQQLSTTWPRLSRISLGEITGAFVLVCGAVLLTMRVASGGGEEVAWPASISAALICASIAVATAPAATVAVMRELQAAGPVSRLVLSALVVNNALSITLFGICVAVARVLLGTAEGSGLAQAVQPVVLTLAALGLGLAGGVTTDLIVHRLSSRADVLIVALTAVFFCGGFAQYLGLSALLAGVAAGFAVVNRDRRDVRAFRALNDFEPPIYGLFFTLAGADLALSDLVRSGAVGAAFVIARAVGKYLGAWLGGRSAGMSCEQATSVGLGLIPQAGLAIGLAFLVRQDASLEAVRPVIINVVVASVVVNELIGPPLVRLMCLRTCEVPDSDVCPVPPEPSELDTVDVVPWTWPRLNPPARANGYVAASLSHPITAPGVVRIATLLGHHYGATPLAVHVVTEQAEDFWDIGPDQETVWLFRLARQEAQSLGYGLSTEVEFADEAAEGLLRVTRTQNVRAIVLGHPRAAKSRGFGKIVDTLAREALCPVVVVKLAGPLHTERILVPISSRGDLATVLPVICALGMVLEHQMTLLRLMPPDAQAQELDDAEGMALDWAREWKVPGQVSCRAVATDSRVHTVLEAAQDHDVVVMAASSQTGLARVFFGSLAEDVAQRIDKPMLLVRAGAESAGGGEEDAII
ncbi:MAG: cation:proton antiporter [Armatimonadetes bacterium]|nr:cation:proton antiporter [Armatimonadota bacterium]